MNRIRNFTLVFIVIAALTSPCFADNFYYYVVSGDVSGPCATVESGVVVVVGVLEFDTPSKGVRFSAPLPPYNATLITETVNFPYTGDLSTGIIVDFDSCLTGGAAVFYREVMVSGPACLCGIHGYSGYGSLPILIDCNDFEYELTDQACGYVDPPYNLMPADGVGAVVLTPTLSWNWEPPAVCQEGLGVVLFMIYLGTDPEDISPLAWTESHSHSVVETLLPNTQYYWYIRVDDSAWEYPGPHQANTGIHTFTTEGPINAEESSWGRIKNLFK